MRIFISDQCWDSIFKLPKNIQLRVRDFQKKFKENPYGHNINLEKIQTFKDSSLRTARINDEYRAIIGVAPGEEYCILYIDHHDEAMRWAENKKFIWNEHISSFQIIPVIVQNEEYRQQTEPETSDDTNHPLIKYSDQQLLDIGVPEEQLTLAREIRNLNDLDEKQSLIPEDVFERLFYLLDDEISIEEIIAEIAEGKAENRNSVNNRRRFVEITGDADFDALIDGDIEKWQIFLHPSQRLLVEGNYQGAVKVSGGGGTGKTVAALHRLKRLATDAPRESVLFTSYTNALIDNIKEKLPSLGINLQAIKIGNIDSIANELAKKYGLLEGLSVNLDFDDMRKAWKAVAEDNLSEFNADFLADEYADIVAYNNLKTEDAYRKISRIGRGKAISPKQRKAIWAMVEDFRHRRRKQGIIDRFDLFNMITDFLNENKIRPFRHVIADEIQDFSNPELRFLRSLVEEGADDLFMVGDPYQRIYNTKGINFTAAGINIRGKRSRRLKINYRTTEEIKRTAVALVEGIEYDDFDGEKESLKGYLSLMHGERPTYTVFNSQTDEINYILDKIREYKNAGLDYRDMVIGCQFKESLKVFQSALHNADIPYWNITGSGNKNGVVLSTLHKLKGLEFKVVFIADVTQETLGHIPQSIDPNDLRQKKSLNQTRRSLMYVAITRAIQQTIITGTGTKAEAIPI